jgi:hypothetical protein
LAGTIALLNDKRRAKRSEALELIDGI